MQNHLQAIVTVLALVNPVMCGAIFAQLEGERPRNALLVDAAKAALAVLVILVLAALLGTRILHVFGVSLDAFSVAGGGVLSWIGFSMLRGSSTDDKSAPHDDRTKKVSLAPLIMFAASPGTITGVITLAATHTRLMFPVTALVAVVVATAIMWLVIVLTIYLWATRRRRWFCARYGDAIHGPDCHRDGSPVCANWRPRVFRGRPRHEARGTKRESRSGMPILLCHGSRVLLCAYSVHAQTAADPLPSWNDGPAKKAIVEFVKSTTTEGEPEVRAAGGAHRHVR